MKKALVVLCLWTAASLVMLFSLAGQKNVLRDDWQSALRKNEVLQTLHDEAKKEWEEENAAMAQEKAVLKDAADALTEENDALKQELEALSEALETARKDAAEAEKQASDAMTQAMQEWEDQRKALTAEKDAASGRLSEVLAFLLTPAPEAEASPAPEAAEEDLFAAEKTPSPEAPFPSPRTVLDMLLPMK